MAAWMISEVSFWVLCRMRHSTHYAECRTMPNQTAGSKAGRAFTAMMWIPMRHSPERWIIGSLGNSAGDHLAGSGLVCF